MSDYGRIVHDCWDELPEHYEDIMLDQFAIMPNHVHCILGIIEENSVVVGAGFKPAPNVLRAHSLTEIIRGFKTFSSRRINDLRKSPGVKVWQRNYYERIIRNEIELKKLREYIQNNPLNWYKDSDNPINIK